jgi:hypothetical protein
MIFIQFKGRMQISLLGKKIRPILGNTPVHLGRCLKNDFLHLRINIYLILFHTMKDNQKEQNRIDKERLKTRRESAKESKLRRQFVNISTICKKEFDSTIEQLDEQMQQTTEIVSILKKDFKQIGDRIIGIAV